MTESQHKQWQLFTSFLKIGAFTFGGGYAMIPLIQKEAVERRHWITDQDILEIVAVAESTPGPIAINSATFVGYRTAGISGAASATLGVVLPSLAAITAISYALAAFERLAAVKYAFFGIRAAVLALIIKALASLYRQCHQGALPCLIGAAAFIAAAFLKIPVIYIIIGAALTGFLSQSAFLRRRR